MEKRKLCLNWHNSSATQSCTNWTQKHTMIVLFMDLVSVTPLSNLVKISLPDRSRLVPQDFSCSYCSGGPRLTADQTKVFLPICWALPVRLIYSLGWLVGVLAPAITVQGLCMELHRHQRAQDGEGNQ